MALQLAAIGVGTLILIDHDTVGPENLAAQGFLEEDLGRLKVDAVGELCARINHEIVIMRESTKFKRSVITKYGPGVVFVCVDSMSARSFIWQACKNTSRMVVDGRMAAEVCRVLVVRGKKDHAHYESTLFSDDEAYEGSCTAKTTLYCANVAAGLMVAQLTKMYRGIPYDKDMQFNVLASELRFEDSTNQASTEDTSSAA